MTITNPCRIRGCCGGLPRLRSRRRRPERPWCTRPRPEASRPAPCSHLGSMRQTWSGRSCHGYRRLVALQAVVRLQARAHSSRHFEMSENITKGKSNMAVSESTSLCSLSCLPGQAVREYLCRIPTDHPTLERIVDSDRPGMPGSFKGSRSGNSDESLLDCRTIICNDCRKATMTDKSLR